MTSIVLKIFAVLGMVLGHDGAVAEITALRKAANLDG